MKSRSDPIVQDLVNARLPNRHGQFSLHCYRSTLDHREHVALVKGDVGNAADVLVRVHSECLTGDVFGSTRCDCGEQLERAFEAIGQAERGVLIYLRQEGRGIGLIQKLRAYNLQDEGLDTVEANLRLGHRADERDYVVAALILKSLGVRSVRLMTNNPRKIDDLEHHGIEVSERVPIEVPHRIENVRYLQTKARKMDHILSLAEDLAAESEFGFLRALFNELAARRKAFSPTTLPFVTLSYAQSIDGSIGLSPSQACALSCPRSLKLTHCLRARHDALLVGVNTVISDDPQLTVRYCQGENPQPVILDSRLRIPETARLLSGAGKPPIILTTERMEDADKLARLRRRARIFVVPADEQGGVHLRSALTELARLGIATLMVEGGAQVITRFLRSGLVDYCVLTITPRLIGGVRAVDGLEGGPSPASVTIPDCAYQTLDSDLIAYGRVRSA